TRLWIYPKRPRSVAALSRSQGIRCLPRSVQVVALARHFVQPGICEPHISHLVGLEVVLVLKAARFALYEGRPWQRRPLPVGRRTVSNGPVRELACPAKG